MIGAVSRGLREGALLVLGAIAVYLLISLVTYHPSDPGWSHTGMTDKIENSGGVAGAWFADVFLYLFGYFAYLFPVMVGIGGWLLYKEQAEDRAEALQHLGLQVAGFVLTMMAGSGLATLRFSSKVPDLPLNSGGILGDVVGGTLAGAFSPIGATLFLLALFLTGVTLFTGLSWFRLMDATGRMTLRALDSARLSLLRFKEYLAGRRASQVRGEALVADKVMREQRPPPRIEPVIKKVEPSPRVEKERQITIPMFEHSANTELPPLALLDAPDAHKESVSPAALEAMSRQVEMKLKDFGIDAIVVEVHPGPVITRFELQPAAGVKVSQITGLAKDLARSLSVISVRVVEIIPGKSVVGLEIPNEHREIVRLSEMLRSKEYDNASSPLSLALGKNIAGHPVVVDLAKMPHLLVAGTTGSGKSVAVNAMILSLLYNATPKEVRLIMIDPKMLELSIYEGIPHLLTPVVTDMKEAAHALRWCVAEMDKRYRLMAAMGVRNIGGYNKKVQDAIDAGQPISDPLFKPAQGMVAQELAPLPYIVVVVDELADMMMVVGKKVEELIARLAQKARASGIHLILATQRPSVDVITGLIKANIPTRIAFQVSSKIDSRTILDQMGAEQLLGHGDMLYLAPGTGLPVRVHGAFVADHEVHKVVDHLKRLGEPQYLDEILQGDDAGGGGEYMGEDQPPGGEADHLYDQALRIVTESRRASISGVQRRLKIGYNRAARLIEEMERSGVVGPLQSNGAREVLAPPPPSSD
ncbi:MAG: DNA translocase FtsK 4TM domain-containing protein [Gammaproteobacteria bacterium]